MAVLTAVVAFPLMAANKPIVEYVTTTKIRDKGRLTIPKQLRDDLGFKPGTLFAVLRLGDGLILVPQQRLFEGLCRRASSSLTSAGVTSRALLATLPQARDSVYGHRYGNRRK